MAGIRHQQTMRNSQMLASHLAGFSRGLTRSEISETLGIRDINDATLWRWLSAAKDQGFIEMTGNTSQARWFASEEIRRQNARNHILLPLPKRPVVTYNELWLKDYVPNQSSYLTKNTLDRIHRRSPVGGAPLSKFDKHDMSMFLCGLSYGSSALEGNSYEMLDTVKLLEEGQVKSGAKPEETKMILNHHEAIRYLIENIQSPPTSRDIGLTAREIRSIHSLLSDGLVSREKKGHIRNEPVRIEQCSYRPMDIRESLESALQNILNTAQKINDPYEQAFFLVVHLSYLQPFIDCNKRTARVACNIPLLRSGVVPMAWTGVDKDNLREAMLGVYEINDTSMISELFVDGYMRSIESFNIMKQTIQPDELTIKYHREIRIAVRDRVLNGVDQIPDNVADCDRPLFIVSVENALEDLRADDHGSMIRHNLKAGDVQLWMANEVAANHVDREIEREVAN